MNKGKISVLKPVYNTNPIFLKESIDSILSQTYSNFELIIVNDGSCNDIDYCINNYNDPRILYYKNEQNMGIAYTRNKLLKLATGEYIAYQDSDDIAVCNRLEMQYDFLEKNPDIDICGGWLEEFPISKVRQLPLTDTEIKDSMLFIGDVIANPTVMMRKKFIDVNQITYREEKIEDYQLWLDILDKATFANLPVILTKYRIHENQLTAKHDKKLQIYTDLVMQEAQQRILGQNLSSFYKLKHLKYDRKKVNIIDIKNFYKDFEKFIQTIVVRHPSLKNECKKVYKYAIKHHFWKISEMPFLLKCIFLYIRSFICKK